MKIISRHQTLFFFMLTIGIAWVIWIPAAIAKLNGSDSLLAPSSLGSLARWTPGLVAVFLTAILTGKVGERALFRPLRYWQVNVVWYIFALFFGVGLFLAAKGLDTLLGNSRPISTSLFELYGA
jgi:hypothetical protein